MQTIALAPVAFARFTEPVRPEFTGFVVIPNNALFENWLLFELDAGNATDVAPLLVFGFIALPPCLNAPYCVPVVNTTVFPFPYTDTVAVVPNGNTDCGGKLKVRFIGT